VNALAGSFTVSLAVAATVAWMTKLALPVSTSQAIVGGIIGWNIFTGSPTDVTSLTKIISTWILCPILAAAVAMMLFKVMTLLLKRLHLHILVLDAYTRIGFIIVGALASYSLGANNIANVMGLFVSATPFADLEIAGVMSISGAQLLFLLGGAAIAVGIYTFSYRVMITVGDELYKITPISGLVVVMAEALVLFLFASEGLEHWLSSAGLPTIPLVPLSSTQVVIGGVIGVGLAKGGKGINYSVLGRIAVGWIAAPLAAGALTLLALFVVQNVFEQKVVTVTTYRLSASVLTALEQQQIPTKPLESFHGKVIVGAANFRSGLRQVNKWSEKDLYCIFAFAEVDSMRVDTVRVLSQPEAEQLTAEQMHAVAALHKRTFVHRWQLDSALVRGSDSWQLKTGSGVEGMNNTLKNQYAFMYRLSRKR
jgi:PiT family inorganic phosphate transporter